MDIIHLLEPIYFDVTMWNIDIDDYHEDYFVVEKDGKRAVLDIVNNIENSIVITYIKCYNINIVANNFLGI